MCLYASVLDVGRCAEDGFGLLLYWNAGCCETDLCMLRYWIWDAVPIWFLYASVLVVERCADFFLYIVFFLALGRMYIRFYSLLSAVEFSAGEVDNVKAFLDGNTVNRVNK